MSTKTSLQYKHSLATKLVNLSTDTLKGFLMQAGFVFDPVAHTKYSDVSASELPTALGYTNGGAALSGGSLTDNTSLVATVRSFNNYAVTVAGGTLQASGLLITDDSVTVSSSKLIVGFIDFLGTQAVEDGGVLTVTNITIPVA